MRVKREDKNNDDTIVKLEPNSIAAVRRRSCGCGCRGNTTPITSQKRSAGGRVIFYAWNHFKKVKLGEEV